MFQCGGDVRVICLFVCVGIPVPVSMGSGTEAAVPWLSIEKASLLVPRYSSQTDRLTFNSEYLLFFLVSTQLKLLNYDLGLCEAAVFV